jgi:hypothetical protein
VEEASSAMSRELDALVAEKVMGWKRSQLNGDIYEKPNGAYVIIDSDPLSPWESYSPTTDANEDYEVLKHVRENWSCDRQEFLMWECFEVWQGRNRFPRWTLDEADHCAIYYEPGDYSKAALKALGIET